MLIDKMTIRGWRIASQATLYATITLIACTIVQMIVLRPSTPQTTLAVLTPLVVCSTLTYLISRGVVLNRAQYLIDIYSQFQKGHVEEPAMNDVGDADFHEARKMFVKLARDLLAAQRDLQQRDAERRRLFADVVHELGTPVSSLLGLSEAFERPAIIDSPQARIRVVNAIVHETDRLARFIEDLRDIAQLDDPAMKLHKEPIDLADLAHEAIDRLNAIPDATTVELVASAAPMSADPERIEQIVINLVKNARRYALSPARILVTVSAKGSRAVLRVEDGGSGVPDEDLAKLGQRMRRLDKSRTRKTGGTGLGLSIVAAIAEKHGGTVEYGRSSLGGLSVTVDLESSV